MMLRTRTVYVVTHVTESIEIVLDRRDQFDKWLTYHNVNRLQDNIEVELKKYITEAVTAYRNSHSDSEKAYAEYLTEKYKLESELIDKLAEEIFNKTEPASEFSIKETKLLNAIKV